MEITATHRFARISPLKARDVARELKGLRVSEALDMIQFTPKKAAFLIGKALKSALANAENNHDLDADNLVVKSATVNEGPTFRRFNPRARGGAAPIRKRTVHIKVILTDEVPGGAGKEDVVEAEPKAKVAKKKVARKAVQADEGSASGQAGEEGVASKE